jgi:hypothetical protein
VEHLGVSHRAGEVLPPKPMVKGNGFGELCGLGRRRTGEPPAAGDGRLFFHGLADLRE